MRASFSPLVRVLLWDLDRGNPAYLVVVAILIGLLLLVPGAWLGDPMAAR